MTRSLLFDISEYQGYTGMKARKWDRLTAKGCIGVILRATIGGRVDHAFAANRNAADDHHLVTAAYHYLQPGDIEAQADLFIATIGTLPGWLDVEQAGITRQHVVRFVKRFRQKVAKGAFLGIYSSAAKWRWLTGNLDAAELFDGQWSAYYTDRAWVIEDVMPTPPSRWGGLKVDLWQFGKLFVGASGSPNRSFVDGNVFDGNRADLLDLYGIKVAIPMDQRPARRKAYNDQLQALIRAISTTPTIAGQGAAWADGTRDVRQDALDALTELMLSDPS